jgi:hypothetical protein
MFILEQKWGNDGYAFWFKLLEILGSSDGHYICLENPVTREFLSAKTRLDVSLCYEILGLLAEIDAIDRELWETEKVVWCQHLVDNIAIVYQKRTVSVPKKPSFRNHKLITSDVSEAETQHNEVSDAETPQSIVDESISEDTISEESRDDASADNEDPSITIPEREILNILKGVKGYRFDYSKDLEFLRKLMVDFPQVDIGEEIKKWEVWLYDHPLTKKSNPRSQIRNWMKNAVKFSEDKNRNRNGPVDRRKMSFEDYMQEAMTYAPE